MLGTGIGRTRRVCTWHKNISLSSRRKFLTHCFPCKVSITYYRSSRGWAGKPASFYHIVSVYDQSSHLRLVRSERVSKSYDPPATRRNRSIVGTPSKCHFSGGCVRPYHGVLPASEEYCSRSKLIDCGNVHDVPRAASQLLAFLTNWTVGCTLVHPMLLIVS